jgi:predicted Fe-Mo cluster-binding NifX family protein
MTQVAVTVSTPDLDAEVEPRFGRAPHILLVDPQTMSWTSVENPGRDAGSGAGIQVAQVLHDKGVSAVISGEFGPKAQDALVAAGIVMHRCPSRATARETVTLWRAGELDDQAPESTGAETEPRSGWTPDEGRGWRWGLGQGGGRGRGRGRGRGGYRGGPGGRGGGRQGPGR